MTATTIDVQDAQTQLMQLLTLALKGDDVVIAKDNVPLVRLVPVQPQKKARTAGMHKGAVHHGAVHARRCIPAGTGHL